MVMKLVKLINERKKVLYIIMLTISILSNFYIGYMECIFCLLYFIYNYINLKKKDTKIIKDFIISSLLSGFMCMITLIPETLEFCNFLVGFSKYAVKMVSIRDNRIDTIFYV